MSVNINADTTNGLVLTSDTSGEIKLQSAGADIATVDSSGITMAAGKVISNSGISSYADSDALSLFNASGSAPVYACRAWASFGGGTTTAGTIYGSGNVSSVTDSATGRAVINFTTDMPNANYAVVGMCTGYSGYNSTLMVMRSGDGSGDQIPANKSVGSVSIAFGHANTVVNEHVGYLTIAIFG